MTRAALLLLTCAACVSEMPTGPAPAIPKGFVDSWLLDVSPTGVRLEGLVAPAPKDSDARPRLTLRLDGRVLPFTDVRDARLLPNDPDGLLVVDAVGELARKSLSGKASRVFASDVEGGVAVSSTCRCAVYVRGEVDPVLALIDLSTGTERVLSDAVSPVWLPTISPDGHTIAFVSGRSGFGAVWTIPAIGGAPVQRTNVGARNVDELGPIPEGPERPKWTERGLEFRNADGAHVIPLDLAAPTLHAPGRVTP